MGFKEQLKELENKIAKGLMTSHKKMLELKKQKNSPVIVAIDGEVVEIDAEDVRFS